MIKQREAQKLYWQLRSKITREVETNSPNAPIIQKLIENEREPAKRTLLQWLQPELENLLKKERSLPSEINYFTSLLPFERLSFDWFANFRQYKLPEISTAPFIDSPRYLMPSVKKSGSIGPVVFERSSGFSEDFVFRFRVNLPHSLSILPVDELKTKALPEPNNWKIAQKKG